MPIAYQASTLQMEWCLDCHRSPEKFVRPKKEVFNMEWRLENKTKEEIAAGQFAGEGVSHSTAERIDELFDLSSLGEE